MGSSITLGCGFFPPCASLRIVLRAALSFDVKDTEVVLCLGQVLCGGFFPPFACLPVVLRNALSVVVEEGEIVLGYGMTLDSCFYPPCSSLCVVLCDVLTLVIESAQFELRGGVARCCALLQIGEGAVCCGLFGIDTFLPLSEIGGLLAGRVVCGQGMGGAYGEEEG